MKSAMGRGAALLAAVATAAALALASVGTANAWENHGGCNFGEALGKGATPLNTFEFNLCQRSADIHDVYGDFMATAPAGSPIPVLTPRGPVTCADIKGHEVGFYYPFDEKSVPPANPAVTGLMIYAFDGGATGDKIGFAPVLANANSDCSLTSPTVMAAKATAVPVTTGTITVTQKGVTMDTKADPPLNAPST